MSAKGLERRSDYQQFRDRDAMIKLQGHLLHRVLNLRLQS